MARGKACVALAVLSTPVLLATVFLAGCRTAGPAPRPSLLDRRSPRPLPSQIRAVWVARFHYHYPDDIRTIMRNCARAGFNTVLWQVRGEGTVAYRSRIEPWSAQYAHRDPGFDPLQIAIEEARACGLRIEAWVNIMPGWRGPDPPPIENQLWHTHPQWFLLDASGNRPRLTDSYAILNPCLPEVRGYITSVIAELVTNYAVDGVHLDYVRYAWDTTPNARQRYPRDPKTLQLYRQQTGKHPDDDPQAWDRWRAERLTDLVRDIRETLRRRRPGTSLTAAVWPNPQTGYTEYLQDAGLWLRSGLLDAAMPMAYTPDAAALDNCIQTYRTLAPNRRIVPGLGFYKHETARGLLQQLELCQSWGGQFAVFSYDSLHATAADRGSDGRSKVDLRKQRLRRMHAAVVQAFMSR